MPVSLTAIGIQAVTTLTLAESVDVTKGVEDKPLKNYLGEFEQGKTINPTFSAQIKGRGDLDAALAVGTDGDGLSIVGISGGVTIITRTKKSFVNDDWNSFEVDLENRPGAS